VDLAYLLAGIGEKFLVEGWPIVVCVDFVVGRDVGWCKIWTILKQAASFMSQLVRLLNLNKAKSALCLSIKWN